MKPKYNFWNQKAPGLRDAKHYDLIRILREDVKFSGETFLCPDWTGTRTSCKVCRELFPRTKKEFSIKPGAKVPVCPCHSSYTRTHLIRVLDMVLRQNKHLKKEKK